MSTGKRLNRRSIGPLHANTSLAFGEVDLADGVEAGRQPILSVNDDDAERLQMRRHRIQQQNVLSPIRDRANRQPVNAVAGALPQTSYAAHLTGLSTAQLAEHYSNCIKLSSENKITMKNAFGLHLIDCMAEMLKNKDPEMSNFQVASCTLDASAKIYGYRVDCVHAETQKIALGLGRSTSTNKRQNGEESDENVGEGGENGISADPDDDVDQHKKNKRKKVNQKSTIEKNPNNLNRSKFDDKFEMEPLFRKTTELFSDGGGSGSVLLGSLRCRNDGCELVLDSLDPFEMNDREDDVQNDTQGSVVDITQFAGLFKKIASGQLEICPAFSNFEFNSWKPGDVMQPNLDMLMTRSVHLLSTELPGEENNFEGGRDDGADGGMEPDDDDDDDDSADVDVRKSTDHKARPLIPDIFIEQPTTERREAMSLMDLTQALAVEPSEYSYFKKGFANAWAGPKHWHVRPLSKGIPTISGNVEPKLRPRKPPIRLDYTTDLFDEFEMAFAPSDGKMRLSRETRRKWSIDNTTLIEDVNYKVESVQQLFLKPSVKIRKRMTVNPSPDVDLQTYDYDNRNDVENFCPAAGVDLRESLSNLSDSDNAGSPSASPRGFAESQIDGDTQIGDSNMLRATHQSIAAFAGDNLVQQPRKVTLFAVPYMRTARRINVRHLKQSIWKILTEDNQQKVAIAEAQAPPRTPTPEAADITEHSFCDVYRRLPNTLSAENAANLSFAMAFACTLHLSNENNLVLLDQKDMKDFTIVLSQENEFCRPEQPR